MTPQELADAVYDAGGLYEALTFGNLSEDSLDDSQIDLKTTWASLVRTYRDMFQPLEDKFYQQAPVPSEVSDLYA